MKHVGVPNRRAVAVSRGRPFTIFGTVLRLRRSDGMAEPQKSFADPECSQTAMQRAYDAEFFARANGLSSGQARLLLGAMRRRRGPRTGAADTFKA